MKESIITAILVGLCSVLLIGAVLGTYLQDRTAPVISLNGKNTLTYLEGDSYDVLLEDMIAVDNVDGDVTGTIRVSNIHVTNDGKAVVIYVAKDSSNNIGKLKREIRYKERATQEAINSSQGRVLPVNAGIERITSR